MVREIYSLRDTLTKNFEVNSTNVTESNERENEHTNGRTSRRKLYSPRHKYRGYNEGKSKSDEADSTFHNNNSLSICIPSFKILASVVPEKIVIQKKFTDLQTD